MIRVQVQQRVTLTIGAISGILAGRAHFRAASGTHDAGFFERNDGVSVAKSIKLSDQWS